MTEFQAKKVYLKDGEGGYIVPVAYSAKYSANGTDLDGFANKDLSNLSATGEKHFLNYSQVTNCIIETPQNLFWEEIENGVRLKAGSKIDGIGECQCLNEGIINAEITEEIYNNIDHYIWNGTDVVLDPDYEEKQRQKEEEHIKRLSCTKRDFALMLQELDITYSQLKTLIASSEQAQLEWDLCERLYRFNPLLDVMAAQLDITPLQLDMIFKTANGENTVEELRALK